MFGWFRRRAAPQRVLRVRSRGEASDATRVAFQDLAPDIETFLGQAAYLQLGYFETLGELIAATPELAHKEALTRAADAALTKHRALVALIRRRDADPTAVMLPFREPLDAFRAATHGRRTIETMLSVHITAGMLDDFYCDLSHSYGDTGARVADILHADDDRQALVELVAAAIDADAPLRSLLALWGRRLVGDTILVARGALRTRVLDAKEEERVEPVFTELLAAHSRRMAAMGLAA